MARPPMLWMQVSFGARRGAKAQKATSRWPGLAGNGSRRRRRRIGCPTKSPLQVSEFVGEGVKGLVDAGWLEGRTSEQRLSLRRGRRFMGFLSVGAD